MKSDYEYENICVKLADIRENLFDDSDFISDDGHDMLSEYVASPYAVLCGMETKIKRLQNQIIKGNVK